jgi:hypothetical protein
VVLWSSSFFAEEGLCISLLVCWLRGGTRDGNSKQELVSRLARQERFRIQDGLSGCGGVGVRRNQGCWCGSAMKSAPWLRPGCALPDPRPWLADPNIQTPMTRSQALSPDAPRSSIQSRAIRRQQSAYLSGSGVCREALQHCSTAGAQCNVGREQCDPYFEGTAVNQCEEAAPRGVTICVSISNGTSVGEFQRFSTNGSQLARPVDPWAMCLTGTGLGARVASVHKLSLTEGARVPDWSSVDRNLKLEGFHFVHGGHARAWNFGTSSFALDG